MVLEAEVASLLFGFQFICKSLDVEPQLMEVPIIFLNDFKPTRPDLVHWLRTYYFVQLSVVSPTCIQLHHRLHRVTGRPALSDPDHSNERALFQLVEARESPSVVDPVPRVRDPSSTSVARHFFYLWDGTYS